MSTHDFALSEFQRAGTADTRLASDVLDLLDVYDHQRHNAPGAVIETFTRLAAGMPIMPLTGEDEEWFEVLPGTEQNRRCANVMRDMASGEAYDTQAYVFENPVTGERWVSEKSRVRITFPYFPRTRIVQMLPPGSDREEALPVIPQESGEESFHGNMDVRGQWHPPIP